MRLELASYPAESLDLEAAAARLRFDDPRLASVEVAVVRPGDPDPVICAREPLPRPVTLDSIKSSKAFKNSPLVRQGRLSVVPLDAGQLGELGRLSGA